MWTIFRLWFILQGSYTRCVGCSLGLLGVGCGERDLVCVIHKNSLLLSEHNGDNAPKKYLLLFYCKNVCTNAPPCYATGTVSFLRIMAQIITSWPLAHIPRDTVYAVFQGYIIYRVKNHLERYFPVEYLWNKPVYSCSHVRPNVRILIWITGMLLWIWKL